MSLNKTNGKAAKDPGKTPVFYGKVPKFYEWKVSMQSELVGIKHAKSLLKGDIVISDDGETVAYNKKIQQKLRDKCEEEPAIQAWIISSITAGNAMKPASAKLVPKSETAKKEPGSGSGVADTSDHDTQGGAGTLKTDRKLTPDKKEQGRGDGDPLSQLTLHDVLLEAQIDRRLKKVKRRYDEDVIDANEKMFSKIMPKLSLKVRKHVDKLPVGHGMAVWAALDKRYAKKSKATRRKLLRAFFNATQQDHELIGDFDVRLQRMGDDLKGMDRKLEEEDYITALIYGTREEYKLVRVDINNKDDDELTYEEVLDKLETFEADELLDGERRTNSKSGKKGKKETSLDQKTIKALQALVKNKNGKFKGNIKCFS